MKIKNKILFSALLIAALLAVGFLEYRIFELKEQKIGSWEIDPVSDCAVALTGGLNRLREGQDLLSRGQIRKLIVAGVVPSASLREIFPLWPFEGSINESDVILERRSTTTYGNAQQTLPIVEALGCRDVLLITSSFHMSRAYRTFASTYPAEIKLIQYPVLPGKAEADHLDLALEVVKSTFYSLWAYSHITKIIQN